ncbi:MAG: tRNA (adenosine(37)-N6)-dimethylallyltransferase MiaA [Chitinophagales bacterium]
MAEAKPSKKYLIVIAGPTAVGKTALAIDLAQYFRAEIVSADSRQFYREMEIGTAKPTPNELAAVPHHFVNNLSIHTKNYSAGKYEAEVLHFLEGYFKQHSIAVITGGSGLFINGVCNGFDSFQKTDDDQLWTVRNFLNSQTLEWLQQETERLDPEYFAVVDKKNPARLKRGLEIIFTTGKKYSEQRIGKKAERPFEVIRVGLTLPREELNLRIAERVNQMMKAGLLEEVKGLYLHKNLHALSTVGYTELFDFLEDKCTLEEAVGLIVQNTRQYAKRQMTWFKKDGAYEWFSPGDLGAVIRYVESKMM